MIRFEQVCKTFRLERGKKVAAVQGLSLQVAAGEVFGCIGPNGAGKSTSIKLLLDLIRPDSGSITINGLPVADETSRARVGYLPENPYIYDFLTAREYLAYARQASGNVPSPLAWWRKKDRTWQELRRQVQMMN